MNLCSEHHEEVCYEGHFCPVCELIEEHETEMERLREANNDEVALLKEEIEELQEQLQVMSAQSSGV